MSLTENILRVWEQSHHDPPSVPLLFHEKNLMVVVSDSERFIRFMSLDGQIYLSLNKSCEIIPIETGDNVYSCSTTRPIFCCPSSSEKDGRDLFVLNKILPLIFQSFQEI